MNLIYPLNVKNEFHFNSSARDFTVEEIPLFTEFRHASWDSDHAVELCRDLGTGWVAVDQPSIRSLMGVRPALTTNTGYIRLHGLYGTQENGGTPNETHICWG